MTLTYHQRKERIPFGGQAEIARKVGKADSWVAMVLKGAYRDRVVERALAAKMTPKTTVTEAFGPAAPTAERKPRVQREKAGAR